MTDTITIDGLIEELISIGNSVGQIAGEYPRKVATAVFKMAEGINAAGSYTLTFPSGYTKEDLNAIQLEVKVHGKVNTSNKFYKTYGCIFTNVSGENSTGYLIEDTFSKVGSIDHGYYYISYGFQTIAGVPKIVISSLDNDDTIIEEINVIGIVF